MTPPSLATAPLAVQASSAPAHGQMLAFLALTPADREAIKAFKPLLQQHINAILERFYQHVMAEPAMAKMIGNPAMIPRLMQAQANHWATLFDAQFDAAYVDRVRRVGDAHYRIGLEPSWFIAAYQFVLAELQALLKVEQPTETPETPPADVANAVQKAVFFDMMVIIEAYNVAVREAAYAELQGDIATIHSYTQTMTDAAIDLNTACDASATAVEQLSSSLVDVSTQAGQAASTASQGHDVSQAMREQMTQLDTKAQHISRVVDVIQAIAEQTNLLALNATIQASKAGEQGKGFMVVANEVKQLSVQSSESAQAIRTQLGELQDEVSRALHAVRQLDTVVETINEFNGLLANTIEQQAIATNEINQNMVRMAGATQQVKANIAQVNDATTALLKS
jgi:hemoglobin-like flavoprotein